MCALLVDINQDKDPVEIISSAGVTLYMSNKQQL